MKITIRDILFAHGVIAREGGLSLPPPAALKLSKITRAIRAEAEAAQEVQQQIVKRHAEKDAEGNPVLIKLPNGAQDTKLANPAAFLAEAKQLAAQEVEVSTPTITLAELGEKPLSSDMLDALAPFLA